MVHEVEHSVVVGGAVRQRPSGWRVAGKEPRPGASGDGVHEQVQLVGQSVGDEGPDEGGAAADAESGQSEAEAYGGMNELCRCSTRSAGTGGIWRQVPRARMLAWCSLLMTLERG